MHQMHHPESTSLRCLRWFLRCLRWFLQTKVHQSQAWLDLCIKHMSLTHLWQLTGNGWTVLTVILHARVSVCVCLLMLVSDKQEWWLEGDWYNRVHINQLREVTHAICKTVDLTNHWNTGIKCPCTPTILTLTSSWNASLRLDNQREVSPA